MKRPTLPVWLLPSIALTVALSAYSIAKRHSVESRNKAVMISVDFDTVESLAASNGTPIHEALENLKAQGVTAIVLGEENVSDLISDGYATVTGNELTLRQDRVVSSSKAIEALADRVRRGLEARFRGAKVVVGSGEGQSAIRLEFASPNLIRQTSIGINPSVAQLVSQSGLSIVCRMSNPPGVSSAYVATTIDWAKESGATYFLPQGDQVLGRREALDTLVESIRQHGMLYATPEFAKIGGDANVVGSAPEIVVRLHSAQTAELDKLPLSEAIDRYAKAARERNMRVLLVRPISNASPDPLASFADFVKKINDEVRREGGDMGAARPFEDSAVPMPLVLLIALSTVPIAYFVATSLVKDKAVAIGLTVVFGLLCLASVTGMGRSLAALGIAVVFPIAAFLVLDARNGKNILAEFLIVCGVSLVGGLAVAGMLNGLPFFVKAQEFRGIKVAVFLPILVLAWYWAARSTNLREAMRNPVSWGAAFLAVGVLVAVVLMNARTGNDSPAAVSDWELKFRSVLDAVLFVRPRTKSFLIGHPALIVGIGLLLWNRKRQIASLTPWIAALLTIGAIGQTDIVNTLCHLHTPVALSLIRNLVGLIPGCIIGFAVWAWVRRYPLRRLGEN
jgi:hypothetical protein